MSQRTKVIKSVKYQNLCHSIRHLSVIPLPGEPTLLQLILNTAKKWGRDRRASKQRKDGTKINFCVSHLV